MKMITTEKAKFSAKVLNVLVKAANSEMPDEEYDDLVSCAVSEWACYDAIIESGQKFKCLE